MQDLMQGRVPNAQRAHARQRRPQATRLRGWTSGESSSWESEAFLVHSKAALVAQSVRWESHVFADSAPLSRSVASDVPRESAHRGIFTNAGRAARGGMLCVD